MSRPTGEFSNVDSSVVRCPTLAVLRQHVAVALLLEFVALALALEVVVLALALVAALTSLLITPSSIVQDARPQKGTA